MIIHVIIKLHGNVLASDRPAEPCLQLDDLHYFAFVVSLCASSLNLSSTNTYHISLREIEPLLTPGLSPLISK